jgi:hypothetical protein
MEHKPESTELKPQFMEQKPEAMEQKPQDMDGRRAAMNRKPQPLPVALRRLETGQNGLTDGTN